MKILRKSIPRLFITIFILAGLLLPAFMSPVSVSATSDLSNWLYCKKLTFANSTIAANLTDFKVCVRLTSSNVNFDHIKANGADIRFFDSDNVTELSYEIASWSDANSTAEIWVKVPQVNASSNTDYINMYYGNSAATDASNPLLTWGSSYVLVAHMDDYPNTSYVKDSANLGGFYKKGAAEPAENSTLIGKSQDFDGSNDYMLGPDPDTAVYSLETSPYTITGNLFQAIITCDGNVAYANRTGSGDANVGIAEYDIKTKSLSFSKHLAAWTTSGGGPESISKFTNGNYLTSDCDSGTNVYEIEPDGDIVWTYDSGQIGTLCRVITMDGVEYLLVEYNQSGLDHYVKILNRSDRSEVWSWDADTFPNDADYRLTATGKKVAIADYLDHTLKVVDYTNKTTDWSYELDDVTDYGPFNVNFIDDTHLLFSEGDTGLVKVIDITDNSTDWTSRVYQTMTRGVRLWGTDKAVITNGTCIYVCDITTAPADLTTLSVSATINLDDVTGYKMIVGHGSGSSSGTGYNLQVDDYLILWNNNDSTGTNKAIEGSTHMSAGTAYRVRATLSEGYLNVYINGIADAEPVACTDIKKTVYNMIIGADASHTTKFFDGKIDEVRIEKRAPGLPEMAAEELQYANTYVSYGTEIANPLYEAPATPTPKIDAYIGFSTVLILSGIDRYPIVANAEAVFIFAL